MTLEEVVIMYKMQLVCSEKQILRFEQLRCKTFKYSKKVSEKEDCSYYDAIESGDMVALECLNEDQMVGGVLLEPMKRDIQITRIFVEKEYQKKGVGSFMLKYVADHQLFFEDYYGTDFKGIIAEPLASTADFYFEHGFDFSGFQMYKSFPKKRYK